MRLLKDEACEAGIHGVTLLGIDRPWFKGRILGKPDGFTVGLSHSPDNLPLLDRLGIQFSVSGHTHAPDRPGDVKHSLADLTRARQILKYEPIVDFDTGLDQTVQWYQQQFSSVG